MFFIKWVPYRCYLPRRHSNQGWCKHPADPRVKVYQTRRAAEAYVAKIAQTAPGMELAVVEAPTFWRLRDPATDAEWQELAVFFNEDSGEALKAQTQLADKLLTELFAD